jgi:hypothetical protein
MMTLLPIINHCAVAWMVVCLSASSAKGALRIEVLRGESANNNAAANAAVSPVVRVFDASEPVSGALVVFTAADSGPRVEFSGTGEIGEAVTDESGFAASPRVRPAGGNGPVSIEVLASKGGEFAQTVIHQMNLGMGEKGAREAELDVVAVPVKSVATPSHGLSIRVRIEDGNEDPVPHAAITCTLRKIGKSGESAELWRADIVSDDHGEAQCSSPKRPGGAAFEMALRAESQGKRATRYFPLK